MVTLLFFYHICWRHWLWCCLLRLYLKFFYWMKNLLLSRWKCCCLGVSSTTASAANKCGKKLCFRFMPANFVKYLNFISISSPFLFIDQSCQRNCRQGHCCKKYSSAKIVFTRYAALVTVMFLPVVVTAFAAQAEIIKLYPGKTLDLFAFPKYTIGWLIPAIMISAAVGVLVSEMFSILPAIFIQGVWWFGSIFTGSLTRARLSITVSDTATNTGRIASTTPI